MERRLDDNYRRPVSPRNTDEDPQSTLTVFRAASDVPIGLIIRAESDAEHLCVFIVTGSMMKRDRNSSSHSGVNTPCIRPAGGGGELSVLR